MLVILSGCDPDKPTAPPPKVAAQAPQAKVERASPEPESAQRAPVAASIPGEPVHELKPNINVVPVTAGSKPAGGRAPEEKLAKVPAKESVGQQKTPTANAKSAKVKADNAEIANRAPVSSKSKSPSQVVKETRLPKAALDLSLPPDMVKQLTPPANVITAGGRTKSPQTGGKPLLPKMFPDAQQPSDFQLQGRLLSNEMELQLRNEARKEVDGAALDFKFTQ